MEYFVRINESEIGFTILSSISSLMQSAQTWLKPKAHIRQIEGSQMKGEAVGVYCDENAIEVSLLAPIIFPAGKQKQLFGATAFHWKATSLPIYIVGLAWKGKISTKVQTIKERIWNGKQKAKNSSIEETRISLVEKMFFDISLKPPTDFKKKYFSM